MSTTMQATSLPQAPAYPPVPMVPVAAPPDEALVAVEAKLERIARILEEQEERWQDLQEVVADLMPAVNGVLRQAADKLDRLEQSGALHALPLAGRFWGRVRDPRGVRPVRPLRAVWALRDPDVARGVGLLLELLRAVGAAARESDVGGAAAAGAPGLAAATDARRAPSPDRRQA